MTEAPPAAEAQTTSASAGVADSTEAPAVGVDGEESITRTFSQSVVISGIRCVLAYVIFQTVNQRGLIGGVETLEDELGDD